MNDSSEVGKRDQVTLRIHIFALLIASLFLIIAGRLVFLQVYKHKEYTDVALHQYVKTKTDTFNRGGIFFTQFHGDPVGAAEVVLKYDIALNPSRLSEADKTNIVTLLSKYITLDKDAYVTKVNKPNDPYEVIAKDVSENIVNQIKKESLPLQFVEHVTRSYTQGEVGAKVIGFVGSNGSTVQGMYGIERYYDDVLARGGDGITANFFAELFANIETNSVSNTDHSEGNVTLTIDANVARFLKEELKATRAVWKSDIIGGIIMDPKTGAIVAMDVDPSFDPSDFATTEDQSRFGDQLVSGVYEMGSIIKPLTMAAALDSGAVTEDTKYNDTGFRELDGYKVKNYDGKARGITSMQTILDKSLNVGIVFLVEKMGAPIFQKYMKAYGLGEESGIDLPGEAHGLTDNLNSKVFVDSATSGFGQGIAITPIQTIRALATLGNGGKLVDPYVVSKITFDDGTVKTTTPNEGIQVIKPETSVAITRMLVHVVDTALKNGDYKMDGYSIAAKTGTAQMPKPGGGYYDDRYLHSFFGYFPAYDPKYIVFLFHTHPKGAEYASATLTDPFFDIVKFLISYYQIPPDR